MSLTPEHRQSLEWMTESLTLRPLDRAAIRAALADLDAATKALEPVARELKATAGYDQCWLGLSLAEFDAVLAAAGEETT